MRYPVVAVTVMLPQSVHEPLDNLKFEVKVAALYPLVSWPGFWTDRLEGDLSFAELTYKVPENDWFPAVNVTPAFWSIGL